MNDQSLGHHVSGMQDETYRQTSDAQAAQHASQYPSGGEPVIAAPAAQYMPQRPSASATLSPGLTWPPGFAGAIAQYIFDSSHRPVPEVAIVAALGLLSGVCGKVWLAPTKTEKNKKNNTQTANRCLWEGVAHSNQNGPESISNSRRP